ANGGELELGRGRLNSRVGQPLGLRRPPRPACSQPSQIPAARTGRPERPAAAQGAAPQIVARAKNSKLSSTLRQAANDFQWHVHWRPDNPKRQRGRFRRKTRPRAEKL